MCMNGFRFHDITHDDMKNGTGLRVVLWVAGCSHHCMNCHNPQTWDPQGGIDFTLWEESEFFNRLSMPWIEGATFSGGDPLHPANRDGIGELAIKAKALYPDKNIWVYTGYRLTIKDESFTFINKKGEVFTLLWLDQIDIIVDGRFNTKIREKDIAANKPAHWRGSSNQRIIDVRASLAAHKIIERKDLYE